MQVENIMHNKRSVNHSKIWLFSKANHLVNHNHNQSRHTCVGKSNRKRKMRFKKLEKVYLHQTKEWWIYLARKDHRRGLRLQFKKRRISWCTQFTIWMADEKRTPSHYKCGKAFSTDHAMTCPYGGLSIARHNEIITAQWLTEVCTNV